PAPNTIHQTILLNVATPLRIFVREHRLGHVFIAPTDVVLSGYDIVQPDILFVRAERRHVVTNANLQGAPDLAIEILSSSNRQYDDVVKLKTYDARGVGEYWVVDPDRASVKIYRRTPGGGLGIVETPDPLTSPLLPGFRITLREVFELDL
ncbi:MAG TPA: Uma2 family endonuclease, partial [Thermoanaerobaculia bacterium]|nr:Uma2 family endonuclease [Thermoanaerobaculia bacterium]